MDMKFRIIILILFTSIFANCDRDNVDLTNAGISTHLYGKLSDFDNNPASNVIIKVGEYKETGGATYPSGFGSTKMEFIQFVKEVYTDNQGNYDFTFQTTGKGNFYRLEIGEFTKPNEPQLLWQPFTYDLSESSDNSKIIGKELELNNRNLYNLFPCDVNIQLNNIQIFPITPRHNKTLYYNLSPINTNQNTTARIYIDKYQTQIFELYRVKPNGIRQKASYTFPASNVEIVTTQNIIVNEIDFVDI